MTEVTLDELIDNVRSKEAITAEPQEVTEKIKAAADVIEEAAKSSAHIKILTDYDADGICSAYIMEKALKSVKSELDVKVVCNDRRNAYGVPKGIETEENTRYIVLDMGSNELDYIRETFGSDTIILDHHLIENEEAKKAFLNDKNLLNPHCMTCDNGKSAEYCATGLAYRVYQTLAESCKEFQHNLESAKFKFYMFGQKLLLY